MTLVLGAREKVHKRTQANGFMCVIHKERYISNTTDRIRLRITDLMARYCDLCY